MNVDAIIFDKDGTLIDFDAFWVTVSRNAISDVLKELGREDIPICEILTAFGVHDGITDINGVLCKGTYAQLGQIVYDILNEHGCNISCDEAVKCVVDAYSKNSDSGEVKPTCPDLAGILRALKNRNIKLAVVTTDNAQITHKCLKELGIESLFDKIYTDDGKTPVKPAPDCAFDFCRLTGVKKERMVMVGDTMTDVTFAKNAGIPVIGVAKTPQNRALLESYADAVISDISGLCDILG